MSNPHRDPRFKPNPHQVPSSSARNTHSSSAPSQTASISTTGQHRQIGQYPSGYPPSAESSGSHRAHVASHSVTDGTASNMLTGVGVQHPVRGHPATDPQSQDWNTTGDGGEGHRSSFQAKGPPTRNPSATYSKQCKQCPRPCALSVDGRSVVPECRFPDCRRRPYFDRRVNEFREWCSDEHLRCAATSTVMVYSGFTSHLGLRYRIGLRTLARRVRYGLDEWALGIVARVFANIRGFSDAFECILYFRCTV
jgi:hypothetical protein